MWHLGWSATEIDGKLHQLCMKWRHEQKGGPILQDKANSSHIRHTSYHGIHVWEMLANNMSLQ